VKIRDKVSGMVQEDWQVDLFKKYHPFLKKLEKATH